VLKVKTKAGLATGAAARRKDRDALMHWGELPVEGAEPVLIPGGITAEADAQPNEGLPYSVMLRLELVPGEPRYAVTRLEVKGDAVTTEGLRQVPVGRLMRAAIEDAVGQARRRRDGSLAIEWPGGKRPPLPKRREGPSDELLAYVALMYRLAHLVGEAPTEYVRRDLDVARATAGRWLAKARDKGLLGEAIPRQAGERI
jgi:hypothetical protein